eukprot:7674822-Pyramimonas_sp.AAC.1
MIACFLAVGTPHEFPRGVRVRGLHAGWVNLEPCTSGKPRGGPARGYPSGARTRGVAARGCSLRAHARTPRGAAARECLTEVTRVDVPSTHFFVAFALADFAP